MSTNLDAGHFRTPLTTGPLATEPPVNLPASETVEDNHAQAIVLKAVMLGLCLDDPWRSAFLRNRWIGA